MGLIWITVIIATMITCADDAYGLTLPEQRLDIAEPFDVFYSTNWDEIKHYHLNAMLNALAGVPNSKGETVVCCRRFTYSISGRFHTLVLIVYDGLITDEETGQQVLVKTYPDQTTIKIALVRAMVHYKTSLGEMDVKPCLLNYTYPLTSPDDQCASDRSLTCDQQCNFQCVEGGYTTSTTEQISIVTCCDKGLFSSSLPTCRGGGKEEVTPISSRPPTLTSLSSATSSINVRPSTSSEHDDSTMSPGENLKYLAILSLAVVFLIIPVVYCCRRKRNNTMYSHLNEDSCSITSEELDVEPDGRGSYRQWKIQPAIPSIQQLDRTENYKMDIKDKGLIYILNNKTFPLSRDEKWERKGSEIDVENVKHVFEEIGYKPVMYENLTAQEIRQSLESLKAKIEPSHPSVVLMFMSHGDEKGILGVDQCHITVREIKNAFSGQMCQMLIGKPKLIFVQACRGANTIKNVLQKDFTSEYKQPPNNNGTRSSFEKDGPEPQVLELRTKDIEPDSAEADIAHYYIAHSTSEGHFSLRSRVEGSCFIQALCEELIKKAHEETLDTIMGLVTRRVQGREWRFNGLKTLQVPQIIKQGIEKDIYLLPKYPH